MLWVHSSDDLEEIDRLHKEIEDMRRSMRSITYIPKVADVSV